MAESNTFLANKEYITSLLLQSQMHYIFANLPMTFVFNRKVTKIIFGNALRKMHASNNTKTNGNTINNIPLQ